MGMEAEKDAAKATVWIQCLERLSPGHLLKRLEWHGLDIVEPEIRKLQILSAIAMLGGIAAGVAGGGGEPTFAQIAGVNPPSSLIGTGTGGTPGTPGLGGGGGGGLIPPSGGTVRSRSGPWSAPAPAGALSRVGCHNGVWPSCSLSDSTVHGRAPGVNPTMVANLARGAYSALGAGWHKGVQWGVGAPIATVRVTSVVPSRYCAPESTRYSMGGLMGRLVSGLAR